MNGGATAMLLPPLSINLSQRRIACVLDPSLALSRYGLSVARGLGDVMELWVVQEFWRILDNTSYYLERPQLLVERTDDLGASYPSNGEDAAEAAQALRDWERLRLETDFIGKHIYWLGDGPYESCVPAGRGPELIAHAEVLSQSLDTRLGDHDRAHNPVAAAQRDTVALAAALTSALVLTRQHAVTNSDYAAPDICRRLSRWQVEVSPYPIEANDRLAALEGNYLRLLAILAGVSKFMWTDLRLAVLHLVVPAASTLCGLPANSETAQASEIDSGAVLRRPSADLWNGASGYWYVI